MAPKPTTTAPTIAAPTHALATTAPRSHGLVPVNSRSSASARPWSWSLPRGYWFYLRSQQIKTINAERALMQAEQSLQSGNMALAQSDLQRVVTRYKGTGAGTEAAMLLAQIDYDAGQVSRTAIKVLEKVAGQGCAAARRRSRASSATGTRSSASRRTRPRRTRARRDCGRVRQRSGRTTGPRRRGRMRLPATRTTRSEIWTQLATDEKAQAVAAEARVRLGELTAKPAKS